MVRWIAPLGMVLPLSSFAAERDGLPLLETGGLAQQDELKEHLPRFRQLNPGFYRGGQPSALGFQILRQHGIRTVVDLRGGNRARERQVVEQLGMKYVHIPLSGWRRITGSEVELFLKTVGEPANHPVFVHCRRGADRTGAMVGVYRISREGWTAKRSYQEARSLGLRWFYFGIKSFLYDFEKSRKVQAHPPATEAVPVAASFP
ncbi:MAG: tyrosine-protein phosphatase [Acidobacteria bacterium]|nr:tyrosine-protein phosphatase [Acidobacteriota bacterium]